MNENASFFIGFLQKSAVFDNKVFIFSKVQLLVLYFAETAKMTYTIYDAYRRITQLELNQIRDFLYVHLGKYGDSKSAIKKALEYACKERSGHGGFVLVAKEKGEILGCVVINKTGMSEYVPENILVYIATHENQRGKGLGTELMKRVIRHASGDIALHVEHDNPAKRLYERMGFTNPYLEMRLKK